MFKKRKSCKYRQIWWNFVEEMFKIYFVGKDQIYSIVSEGGGKSMIRPNGGKILSFREYIDIFLL